jgi:hypothetical protein
MAAKKDNKLDFFKKIKKIKPIKAVSKTLALAPPQGSSAISPL